MKLQMKALLSALYGTAAEAKNFLYDAGFADTVRLPVPVLSVGNLSMGGTGKTPVVEALLIRALEKDLKVAVIARNYKAQSYGPCKVDPQRLAGGKFYGDEAFLIAQKFPQVSVWTGPKKYRTAQQAVTAESLDLLIIDDGFQHRTLQRDFELVLIDASAQPMENKLLPLGRLRERFSSLRRATAVALTKVNFAPPEQISELLRHIPKDVPVVHVQFDSQLSYPLKDHVRCLALSGIAQPSHFMATLGDMKISPVEHMIFSDHHPYSSSDVVGILQKMKTLECDQILTTEKDFVKLQEFPDLVAYLNPIQLQARFQEEPRGLNEFLDQCLRH